MRPPVDVAALAEWVHEDSNGLIRAVSDRDRESIGAAADEVPLELHADDDGGCRRRFVLHCRDVRASDLRSMDATSMQWTDDHPVLWRFVSEHYLLHLTEPARDQFAVVGRLWVAHEAAAEGWLELRDHVNHGGSCGVEWLLRQPRGLLARGPRPLIDAYATALEGVLSLHQTRSYHRDRDPGAGLRALDFDDGFVVCRSVEVEELDP